VPQIEAGSKDREQLVYFVSQKVHSSNRQHLRVAVRLLQQLDTHPTAGAMETC